MFEAYLTKRLLEALSLAGEPADSRQRATGMSGPPQIPPAFNQPDERCAVRYPARTAAMLHYVGSQPRRVVVSDLSTCGFRIELAVALRPGRLVALEIDGLAPIDAYVVWQEGDQVGCKFLNDIHPALVQAALAIGSRLQ